MAIADFAVILGVGLLVKALCTYGLRIGNDFYFSSWGGSYSLVAAADVKVFVVKRL